jgi:hypothetical protein
MNTRLLNRQLVFLLQRLGPIGWLGLAMLLVALVGLAALVLPKQGYITALDGEIERQADLARQRAHSPQAEPLTPAQQLTAFYKVFPRGSTIPDWLELLNETAQKHEIELDMGDYVMGKSDSGRLEQFRISLPVQATYPQIRAFIRDALARMPALALESVAFKREQVDEDFIDARIVFRLYLEKEQ